MANESISDGPDINIVSARKALIELSKQYCSPFDDHQDSVFADGGVVQVLPAIKRRLDERGRWGVGLLEHGECNLSLLPELPVQIPVLVTELKISLTYTRLIANIILGSSSISEAMDQVSLITGMTNRRPHVPTYTEPFGLDRMNSFASIFERERECYGSYHWAQPERFLLVRQALQERPPIFFPVPISHANFFAQFSLISRKYHQPITFLKVYESTKRADLDEYPVEDDAMIIIPKHLPSEKSKDSQALMITSLDEIDSVNG